MTRALPLFALTAALLGLATYGAGIYPWTVCAALMLFSAVGITSWVQSRKAASTPHSLLPTPYSLHILYAITLMFIIITLIPLPLSLTKLTGQYRFEQHQRVADVLVAAKSIGIDAPDLMWFSLTRSRAGGLRAMLLLATLFGAWLTARTLTPAHRALWIRLLTLSGSTIAILGYLGKWVFPQGDTLWWIIPVPHSLPGPIGGFINPNHFAGFIAMLAPVSLATAFSDARQKRWIMMLGGLAAFALMTLVILFSLSRGAVVAYAGGMTILLAGTFLRGTLVAKCAMGAATILIIAATLVFALRNDRVHERLMTLKSPATTASLQARLGAWKDTAGMIKRYPIAGVGANAFYVTYPQHRTSSSRAPRDFAENEYVQIIGETGTVGAIVLLLLLMLLFKRARHALKPEDSPEAEGRLVGAVALAVVATHALVDFPLHLPLYAITAVTLIAYLWPAASDATPHKSPLCPHIIAILIALFSLGLGTAIRLDSPSVLSSASTPELTRALIWAPTSPLIWRRLSATLSENDSRQHKNLAEHCLTTATTYDPNNYPLWRRLGEVRQEMGDNRGANEAYRRVESLRDWIKLPVLPEH